MCARTAFRIQESIDFTPLADSISKGPNAGPQRLREKLWLTAPRDGLPKGEVFGRRIVGVHGTKQPKNLESVLSGGMI